jgi:hypothetical protein
MSVSRSYRKFSGETGTLMVLFGSEVPVINNNISFRDLGEWGDGACAKF